MSSLRKEQRAKIQKVRFALGQVRLQAEEALKEMGALEAMIDPSFPNWKCDGCGYEKNFTKPSTIAACDACPRCKGTEFSPVVKAMKQ